MVEPFLVPPSRLLYRLVGALEYQRVSDAWRAARERQKNDHSYIAACASQLVNDLGNLMNDPEFGEKMHTHTMTPLGGGQIGGPQPFVSMFSDFEALASSTDDKVQTIVRSVEYVLTFSVPKGAAIGAASDLSGRETEVLVPNNLNALAAMLIDQGANPRRVVT